MKKFSKLFGIVLATFCLTFGAMAADFGQSYLGPWCWGNYGFAGMGATNTHAATPALSNTAWFATPPINKAPKINYILASGDIASQFISVYSSVFWTPITTNTAAAATNLFCATNGIVANDIICLWDSQSQYLQRLVVTSVGASFLRVHPVTAFIATNTTSKVFLMKKIADTAMGISEADGYTNHIETAGLVIGREGAPLMIECIYSNGVSPLRFVSGEFIKP